MGNNAIGHSKMMHAIEFFGTKVTQVVRKEIAARNTSLVQLEVHLKLLFAYVNG
jgi:hypothetical protein